MPEHKTRYARDSRGRKVKAPSVEYKTLGDATVRGAIEGGQRWVGTVMRGFGRWSANTVGKGRGGGDQGPMHPEGRIGPKKKTPCVWEIVRDEN